MFGKQLAEKKQVRIELLLREGLGINEICRIEGVSNTPVRKACDRLGIRPVHHYNTDIKKQIRPVEFKCPGLQGCVTCKHIFQHGCPMSTDLP